MEKPTSQKEKLSSVLPLRFLKWREFLQNHDFVNTVMHQFLSIINECSVRYSQPAEHQTARDILHNGQGKNEMDLERDAREEKYQKMA